MSTHVLLAVLLALAVLAGVWLVVSPSSPLSSLTGQALRAPSAPAVPGPSLAPAANDSNHSCDPSLWDHVYHPQRLQVVDPCVSVTGNVSSVRGEDDGDYHVRLTLDAPYASLVNDQNRAGQHGDLVVEPVCEKVVTQADAVDSCVGFSSNVTVPKAGWRVRVTGSYVLDLQHGGWAEIHPASRIERIA